MRILTDRGTEFCSPYDEHRRADHKMVLEEFRKRLYVSLEGKPGTVSC